MLERRTPWPSQQKAQGWNNYPYYHQQHVTALIYGNKRSERILIRSSYRNNLFFTFDWQVTLVSWCTVCHGGRFWFYLGHLFHDWAFCWWGVHMESICLTLVNCFPFFALKKVSLTNISNIQVYVLGSLKRNWRRRNGLQTLLLFSTLRWTVYKGFVYR